MYHCTAGCDFDLCVSCAAAERAGPAAAVTSAAGVASAAGVTSAAGVASAASAARALFVVVVIIPTSDILFDNSTTINFQGV